MEKRETPPVDENDPGSSAVEIKPDKMDLQSKPQANPGKKSPRPDSLPPSTTTPSA